MNIVVILTRNCLELTKRCVKSVKGQDIPTTICIFDNGSTDGTVEWASDNVDMTHVAMKNRGVSFGWNIELRHAFRNQCAKHVLVLNNDVMLPPYFYRTLLELDLPFVTGASVDCVEALQNRGPFGHPHPGPDFSGFLIRKDCWDTVGQFDESMQLYASDNDYHVRAHRLGVELLNSGVPFYHERSSTLKNAELEDQQSIQKRADEDRLAFKMKYGCFPWEPGYADLFSVVQVMTSFGQ